jgi:hypothetical protein
MSALNRDHITGVVLTLDGNVFNDNGALKYLERIPTFYGLPEKDQNIRFGIVITTKNYMATEPIVELLHSAECHVQTERGPGNEWHITVSQPKCASIGIEKPLIPVVQLNLVDPFISQNSTVSVGGFNFGFQEITHYTFHNPNVKPWSTTTFHMGPLGTRDVSFSASTGCSICFAIPVVLCLFLLRRGLRRKAIYKIKT